MREEPKPLATVVHILPEQDHRLPSILENHIFADHVVQTHSHIRA